MDKKLHIPNTGLGCIILKCISTVLFSVIDIFLRNCYFFQIWLKLFTIYRVKKKSLVITHNKETWKGQSTQQKAKMEGPKVKEIFVKSLY